MKRILNYIGGELVVPQSGSYLDNIDPSIGHVYSKIPDSDERDVDFAVVAAQKASESWSKSPVEDRSSILMAIAELIDKNLDDMARAESIDNGKPLSLAKTIDIPRAASNFRFYASAIINFSSKAHISQDKGINYTIYEPLGVVGCISPWNLPLYLFSWKIAPALAAGNCVVAKPSEITPMTAFLLAELCIEAGLPSGVLNIVHGLGPKVGESIVCHEEIKAVSFTGGTKTGARIASLTAPMFKKLSLELGGKNPNIIFDDCDFDRALSTTLRSSFSNQGEICLCGSRIYVQQGIYDKFLLAFIEKTKSLLVGDPLEKSINIGAIVSEAHLQKILGYISLAQEEGGTIVAGGERVISQGRCEEGYFVQPTIITGLAATCRTNQEEIFGPVVTIQPFETEEEVVGYANGTAYGLSATLWTENLSRAHRLSARLKSGIIWVNCWLLRDLRTPFGGMKQSGVGREGGEEALRFFTEPKNVCIKV